MIFRPVMQFNGRYEKAVGKSAASRRDATNTRSLRESVNLYADIPVIAAFECIYYRGRRHRVKKICTYIYIRVRQVHVTRSIRVTSRRATDERSSACKLIETSGRRRIINFGRRRRDRSADRCRWSIVPEKLASSKYRMRVGRISARSQCTRVPRDANA